MNLERQLACPSCRAGITSVKTQGTCSKCGFKYKKANGIWHFLEINQNATRKSAKQYERMHKGKFGGPEDGSYEILAAIARGNKTLDIACGEGRVEALAPDTVGVEFSLNALRKAKRTGAKHLVLADAHNLPFRNNSFDVSISSGNLEHFENPQIAINEMARVSKIQVLVVHKKPSFPINIISSLASTMLGVEHQPIERPISQKRLMQMLSSAGLHVVFKGEWTLPTNYGRTIKPLPEIPILPCCTFVISHKDGQE